MNEKTKKIITAIVVICILILIIEGGFVLYTYFKRENSKSYFDSINAYEKTSDGYIAVGSNNDNNKGYEKAKITKYDNKKEKVWEKFYNKGYNSTFSNVAIDEDNYLVVGSFEEKDPEKKSKNSNPKSILVKSEARTALFVKYDSKGEVVFEKKLQILGNSKFVNVKVVDDGYIVVGQSIFENAVLGIDERGGGIIIKYDKTGKEMWRSNYGGAKSGLYNDLYVDKDSIYVVGKDAARVGIISKYTLDGERISTTNYEYTDTLGFSSITKIGNQLIVVGAKKLSEDQNDYDTDALIVKYDLDCDILDEVTYKGEKTGMERFNKVIVDSDNNLVIIGHTAIKDEKESTKRLNVFRYDGILVKYKPSLKKTYSEHYGETNYDDYFTDIEEVDNNYLVSGYSSYKKDGYLSKFITYSKQGKSLEVK